MRQAVMTAPGVVEIVEAAVPEPGSKQIQINIKRIGICGSDVHVWHGAHPFTSYPVIQGHEYCGIVSKIGSDVTDIRRSTGDCTPSGGVWEMRAMPSWQLACL